MRNLRNSMLISEEHHVNFSRVTIKCGLPSKGLIWIFPFLWYCEWFFKCGAASFFLRICLGIFNYFMHTMRLDECGMTSAAGCIDLKLGQPEGVAVRRAQGAGISAFPTRVVEVLRRVKTLLRLGEAAAIFSIRVRAVTKDPLPLKGLYQSEEKIRPVCCGVCNSEIYSVRATVLNCGTTVLLNEE
ncbi:uncharacterized protein LOC118765834 [Octopus sinensis]|uniref:Uncharacterized protein LOC118765834 n=1 Tax=Octopus sinensis TaxID=2607531 RepID=A0A7E6F980_9MOLL|nr:uncharacterized protein LOC118765834 [Octopus sinensis]